MSTPPDAIRQAELILKLYEVRREAVMRQARSYVGGEFMPTSVEDFPSLTIAENSCNRRLIAASPVLKNRIFPAETALTLEASIW